MAQIVYIYYCNEWVRAKQRGETMKTVKLNVIWSRFECCVVMWWHGFIFRQFFLFVPFAWSMIMIEISNRCLFALNGWGLKDFQQIQIVQIQMQFAWQFFKENILIPEANWWRLVFESSGFCFVSKVKLVLIWFDNQLFVFHESVRLCVRWISSTLC